MKCVCIYMCVHMFVCSWNPSGMGKMQHKVNFKNNNFELRVFLLIDQLPYLGQIILLYYLPIAGRI